MACAAGTGLDYPSEEWGIRADIAIAGPINVWHTLFH
jgi:hypothetical protein